MQKWEDSLVVWEEFHHPVEDGEGGNSQTHLRVFNGAGGEASALGFWGRKPTHPPALSHARL